MWYHRLDKYITSQRGHGGHSMSTLYCLNFFEVLHVKHASYVAMPVIVNATNMTIQSKHSPPSLGPNAKVYLADWPSHPWGYCPWPQHELYQPIGGHSDWAGNQTLWWSLLKQELPSASLTNQSLLTRGRRAGYLHWETQIIQCDSTSEYWGSG